MKQLAQIVVATVAGLAWMAVPAVAGGPAPSSDSIFDGQWSCEFRVGTKPGGTFMQNSGADSIQNGLTTAVKSSFQVSKNGSFSWEERKNSHFHADSFYACKNGLRTSVSFDQEEILKVAGQVVDTKTRTLKVTVDHEFGSGRFTDASGDGTIVASADGSSQTFFPSGSAALAPVPHSTPIFRMGAQAD